MAPKLPDPPTGKSQGDIVLSVFKGAAGAIPFLGGALGETINVAIASPAEKRLNEWLMIVADAVNALIEKEGLTAEDLSENEAFVTAVIATTQAALLTTRREKLQILRGVIYQTGRGTVLDEFVQATFLSIVDRYTPEHVVLLRRLADPSSLREGFERLRRESPERISTSTEEGAYTKIEHLAPHLLEEISSEVAEELFSDLHRDRLCHGSEGFAHALHVEMIDRDAPVTVRGREFLKFVSCTPHDRDVNGQ